MEQDTLTWKQMFDILNSFMWVFKIKLNKFEEWFITRLWDWSIWEFKLYNKEINYLKKMSYKYINKWFGLKA